MTAKPVKPPPTFVDVQALEDMVKRRRKAKYGHIIVNIDEFELLLDQYVALTKAAQERPTMQHKARESYAQAQYRRSHT